MIYLCKMLCSTDFYNGRSMRIWLKIIFKNSIDEKNRMCYYRFKIKRFKVKRFRKGFIMQAILNGNQFRKLLEKEYGQIHQAYNLKRIDIQILQYLNHAGQQNTAKDIVALGLFTKGHVSQSLKNLKERGLVEAVPDRDDARCVHLRLQDDAYDIIRQIDNTYENILKIMFHDIPAEDLEVFKRVGQQIVKNINAYVE